MVGASRQIGNYFSVVSGLTSVVMVGFPILLIAAGAPAQRPDISLLARHLHEGLNIGNLALFGVLVFVAGVTVHPLQFGMTQILEGYWGHGRLQRRAMGRSQRRHTATWWKLRDSGVEARDRVSLIDGELTLVVDQRRLAQLHGESTEQFDLRERELLDSQIEPSIAWEMAGMAAARYPVKPEEVVPTRLGNVLRRHERYAGARFELDAVTLMPYLSLIAEAPERSYLDDTRSAMDLPIRMVLVWALCTLEGVLLVWRYDVWLVLPLLTYALAYLAYRGAVSAASDYGNALGVVLTLGRRNLYERLNIEFPPDLANEQKTNKELDKLLGGSYGEVQFTASPAFKRQRKRWWPW
jgi:hypothetical protein